MQTNKIVVAYESKYGTTKKYAEWIAEALSADLCEKKSINLLDFKKYDTIIYGGGLYAGGVSGISLITKKYNEIKDKNIIIFTCGLADPTDDKNVKHIRQGLDKIFTAEMKKSITIFHLRGRIDYKKLGLMHKGMMAILHKMIARKEQASLSDEDQQMMETYGKVVDFMDKTTIEPIVSFAQGLSV